MPNKIVSNSTIAISLFLTMLLMSITASAKQLDNHGVYWKSNNTCNALNSNMGISIYPCNASVYSPINITQLVNLSWNGDTDKQINWFFAYDNNLTEYHAYIKQNTSYNNGSYEWHELDVKYAGFNNTGNNWEYYIVENETLTAGKIYELMWVFTTQNDDKNGMWRIFSKYNEMSFNDAIAGNNYTFLDPWWNELTLENNTIALYHFDTGSGTTAYDETGVYNATFKASGEPAWTTTSRFGSYAVNFIAADGDYINQNDLLGTMPPNGTIEFWFRSNKPMNDTTDAATFFHKITDAPAETLLEKRGSYDSERKGKICFWISNSGDGYFGACTNITSWDADKWYYVMVTWGSNGMNVYINGTLSGHDAYTGYMNGANRYAFCIGSQTSTYRLWFDGIIDEFRVSDVQKVPQMASTLNITIYNPLNTTYTTTSRPLEVSANATVSNWWYKLNSGSNISFTPNTTIMAAIGSNLLIVYANNSAGNVYSRRVGFTITPPPIVKPPVRIGLFSSAIIILMMAIGFVLLLLKTMLDINSSDELINKSIFILVACLAFVSAVGIILSL